MTVGELKEILQNVSDEVEICLDNGDGIVTVDEVEIDKYFGLTRRIIFK